MVHDLRLGEEFFAALCAYDAEIAGQVATAGCPHCGGPLYQANYERKPRGAAFAAAGEAFTVRHSLCCGRRMPEAGSTAVATVSGTAGLRGGRRSRERRHQLRRQAQ
jgi:hypothetical protein